MNQRNIDIVGCELVRVVANRDGRGCLHEIFRESWSEAFPTVQWNACSSASNVVRGVHVHVDYDEFYTLPHGRVVLGLVDIRRESPSFRKSVQFEWSDKDGFAVVVPKGVAHVVMFVERSVLVFGLSDYWHAEYDILGCRWDDPELGFEWNCKEPVVSCRDSKSGTFQDMLSNFEEASHSFAKSTRQ